VLRRAQDRRPDGDGRGAAREQDPARWRSRRGREDHERGVHPPGGGEPRARAHPAAELPPATVARGHSWRGPRRHSATSVEIVLPVIVIAPDATARGIGPTPP